MMLQKMLTILFSFVLVMAMAGCAESQQAARLTSIAWPAEYNDGRIYLACGTVQQCFFLLSGQQSEKNTRLVVSVPRDIEMLDPTGAKPMARYYLPTKLEKRASVREGRRYTDYSVFLDRPVSKIDDSAMEFHDGVCLFFKSRRTVRSSETMPVYYHLEADGTAEEENRVNLVLLPPIHGKRPKNVYFGVSLWTHNPSTGVYPAYIDTVRKVGFNTLTSAPTDDPYWGRISRKPALAPVALVWWFWWNSTHLKSNPADTALDFNLKPTDKVCPTVLLANNGRLVKESLPWAARSVKDGKAIGFDWDLEGPSCWDVCFCDGCIAAFRKRASLSEDISLTPETIKQDHAQEWIDFCCLQSANMCSVMRDAIHQVNPGSFWGVYCGPPNWPNTKPEYRVDWETLARGIDVAYLSGYTFNPADLGTTFVDVFKTNAANVRKWAGHPVRVISFLTPGLLRGDRNYRMPDPRLTKAQALRSMASGADGINLWWWGTLDGRQYTCLAEASTIIADFEDFFLKGEYEPGFAQVTAPQGWDYSVETIRLGNRRLVMLFNNSPSQSAKFALRFSRTPTGSSGYRYPGRQRFDPLAGTTVEAEPFGVEAVVVNGK